MIDFRAHNRTPEPRPHLRCWKCGASVKAYEMVKNKGVVWCKKCWRNAR